MNSADAQPPLAARLEACLPDWLLRRSPRAKPVSAGLSGALVIQLEAQGEAYVLKCSAPDDAAWPLRLQVQQSAAAAGLAPEIVHVEPAQRAVLSRFLADQGLAGQLFDPRTRTPMLIQLGQRLDRLHALPIPDGLPAADPAGFVRARAAGLAAKDAPPAWLPAIETLLAELPPSLEPAVLSHNDVNPSNLIYAHHQLWLVDWDAAAANAPDYDLATVALFWRLDQPALEPLAPASRLAEPRFGLLRRIVAAGSGLAMLEVLAFDGSETLEAALTLGEVYGLMQQGRLDPGSPEGRKRFGLALIRTALDGRV